MKKLLLSFFLFSGILTANAQWAELGTGTNVLNPSVGPNASLSHTGAEVYNGGVKVYTNSSGILYATSYFSSLTESYCYIKQWNGSSWLEVGDEPKALNRIEAVSFDHSGNIYMGGDFQDSNDYYYVIKWDGSTWNELGKSNNALKANQTITTLAVDDSGNVYAAGLFTNTAGKFYVAKWDGTTWNELGSGSNALNANNEIFSVVLDDSGNVYTAGFFSDANGKQYVAKWNGKSWSEIGGLSGNILNTNGGSIFSICLDNFGNLYAWGGFENSIGKQYVAKWDGITWSEVGTGSNALNANDAINIVFIDSLNNLYAGGDFKNPNGKFYIAKWDGVSWTELGSLDANGAISSICSDNNAYIYTSGGFTDSSGYEYVAKYSQTASVTGITSSTVSNATITAYPNPTTGNITIITPEAGRVSVYNTLGELVASQPVQATNTAISLGNAPTGIYTVLVTGQNNTYTPIKIIKN